jgi:hypothetical protein
MANGELGMRIYCRLGKLGRFFYLATASGEPGSNLGAISQKEEFFGLVKLVASTSRTDSMGRRIGGRRFKPDDGFIGLGVAEFFAGEAFDGFGVVAERLDFGAELPVGFLLLFLLGFQLVNFAAHPLVFLDDRQEGPADHEQDRQRDERDDRLRELVPNAEINFHPPS